MIWNLTRKQLKLIIELICACAVFLILCGSFTLYAGEPVTYPVPSVSDALVKPGQTKASPKAPSSGQTGAKQDNAVFDDEQSKEEKAIFDDSESDDAVFEEEDADFVQDGPGEASVTQSGSVKLLHSSHFSDAQFFPDRTQRFIEKSLVVRLMPFGLILCFAFMITPVSGWKRQRKISGRKEISKKKTAVAVAVAVALFILMVFLTSTVSYALQYSSVKEAVTDFLGKDKKPYQTYIDLTPDKKVLFKKEISWIPAKDRYKVYYSKADNGKPADYVYVLSDKLKICGGLHKYCVKVSTEGKVEGVKITDLTCERSYCINSKSFLSQFKNFDITNSKQKAKSYDAISGATQSTDLTRDVVQRALMFHRILKQKAVGE
ncbi:MAG: FMN-binding protein [Desulfobacteraceae bacterium]|nr:FMN-binding protein [Desulfobacteraceae bacterium]